MRLTLGAAALLMACSPRFSDTADPFSGHSGSTATATAGTATATQQTGVCAEQGFGHLPALWATDLSDALKDAVLPQVCEDYATATFHLFVRLDKVDDAVTGVYTGRSTPVYFEKPDGDDMNTEHSWPQSEGADTLPAKCDLHHLYPADSDANAVRASHPFGDVVSGISWEQGGSKLGNDAGGTTVFEPRDVHKGNVARSMIYFSLRYAYPLDNDQMALFKDWDAQDPVDQAEIDRTLNIADFQELANPLVVCPELVNQL